MKPTAGAPAAEEDAGEGWAALAAELEISSDEESGGEDARACVPCTVSAPPAVPLVVSRTTLTHAEFREQFRHQQPVVLRGFAASWPALSRWGTASHLGALLQGHCEAGCAQGTVLVLRSHHGQKFIKRDCAEERRPFAAVVRELFGQRGCAGKGAADGAAGGTARSGCDEQAHAVASASVSDAGPAPMYSRAPLAAGLRAEVDLTGLAALVGGAAAVGGVETGASGVFKDSNCGVWLGSGGNSTPLHYDLCHGFLVQVIGVKTVTYFAPDDFRCLYQRAGQPELSNVDLDCWTHEQPCDGGPDAAAVAAERARHPRFADAMPRTVTLRPGDVLYTPPFWWHHVRTGAEAALSVLVPFDPAPEEPVHISHFV